ncbi:MAG: TrkH family potassium uptake protein [Actinomycetota bacterium]|nr:TrkH family potassium uptake protein [Actinomycetota bacterium]
MSFAAAIAVVTALLMLPAAAESGAGTPFRVALFTATSAVCVTGLVVVDTETHWSTFGEVVILVGMQVGGFGIMTLASLLGLLVSRRLGLRTRLLAQAESKWLELGDVARVVRGVAVISLTIEAAVALVLGLRFWLGYGEPPGRAAYLGVFHSISAFNNAGFALWSDSLTRFAADAWITVPVALAVFLGALGFPVLIELTRELTTPKLWSLHTKITLGASGVLLFGGTAAIAFFEWGNPATLGPLDLRGKLLASFFHGVMPRSGGFNVVDVGRMTEPTWLVNDVLMFIGGGSASTGGGIKVTTFTVLLFAILSEARGDPDVDAFGRRISVPVIRQALAVALIGVAVVVTATLLMLSITGLDLDRVLFEVLSASATVGLSTGITADLPPAAQYLLVLLMFLGRTSTITLASALALRERRKLYRLPEERPVVG